MLYNTSHAHPCWSCGPSGWSALYTMGGFIHLLLVAALILILVRIIQGRSKSSEPTDVPIKAARDERGPTRPRAARAARWSP